MTKRRWKRKLGLAILGLAVFTPLLAFGISNLFLVSPKGRAFIADRIQRRLPLEASVQGATWSPWNGITVYGLRLEQPGELRKAFGKPLLSAQSVRIHPDWAELARKRLSVKGMDIEKPDLTVPIELLSQIPHKDVDPALAMKAPDLAAMNPPAAAASQPGVDTPPAPPIAGIIPPAAQAPQLVAAPAPVTTEPTAWLRVRNGRLRIVSLMSPSPLFHAAGVAGGVPFAGKAAASKLTVARLTCMGNTAPAEIAIPLKWAAPALSTGAIGGGMFGLDFKVGGQIGFVQGMPFRIDAVVPEQKDREIRPGGGVRAKLGTVAAQGRLQGYLQAPGTWQGQWIAEAIAVDTELGAQKNRFDRGHALLVFQNGAIRCLDARLVSEDVSVIGNAMLLSDGRMAANARIVAAPETLVAISRFTQPDSTAPHLTPLSTPQRSALDLQFLGTPGKILYKPNPKAVPVLLR
jgi:hypothetical protein